MKKGCRREGQKEEDKIVHYTKCNGKAEKQRDIFKVYKYNDNSLFGVATILKISSKIQKQKQNLRRC
jgi:hypothetical protein